jgi:hypothetical protein
MNSIQQIGFTHPVGTTKPDHPFIELKFKVVIVTELIQRELL